MIEKQSKIPDQSVLKKDGESSFHYIDSFQSQYLTNGIDYDIIGIGKLFLSSGLKSAETLMSIRDKVAGLFKLKTAGRLTAEQRNPENYKFEPGEQLDIFKLYAKTENELILGEDDKHLSFRVSLLLDSTNDRIAKKRITITTVVTYRNLFGRLYFIPVRPFHEYIVKSTLKEIIRKVEKKKSAPREI